MEELLDQILNECRPYTKQGAVATYIPELSKQNPDDFGIYIISSDGSRFSAGDHAKHFTIQSVVKPVLLLLALMDNGVKAVRTRIGVEATGKPFDAINVSDKSLVPEHFNPMVNAGAILLCTMLKGNSYSERFARLLELIRRLADNPEIDVDEAVFRSERETGFKTGRLHTCSKRTVCSKMMLRMCWNAIFGPAPFVFAAGIWHTSAWRSPTMAGSSRRRSVFSGRVCAFC